MALLRIKGYDQEMRAIGPTEAHLGALAELQYQTGWTMKEMNERGNLEFQALSMMLFLTLHQNGHRPKWADVLVMGQDATEWVEEPGDTAGKTDDDADPTTARTDSAPGAAAATTPAKASGPATRSKTGSKRASSSASSRSTK